MGRGRVWRIAAGGTALAVVVPLTASSPDASADPDGAGRVAKLTREIKALEKEYGGSLEQLRDARSDAAGSLAEVRRLNGELTRTRSVVAEAAASEYMTSGLDPALQMLTGEDPAETLGGAALGDYVARGRATRIRQVEGLVARQERTRREAEGKIGRLEDDVRQISARREEVKRLIKKYKPQSPMVGSGGMTPRMVTLRDELEAELGPFPTIGCTRPGDPQDHGTGRACDFMESTAGSMPSAARVAHGDQVAAYVIRNADRLGLKYVIWRQRIYDMRDPGWRTMSDRGSVTQNHMDHNHVSVF